MAVRSGFRENTTAKWSRSFQCCSDGSRPLQKLRPHERFSIESSSSAPREPWFREANDSRIASESRRNRLVSLPGSEGFIAATIERGKSCPRADGMLGHYAEASCLQTECHIVDMYGQLKLLPLRSMSLMRVSIGVFPTSRTKNSCSITCDDTVLRDGSRRSSLPNLVG